MALLNQISKLVGTIVDGGMIVVQVSFREHIFVDFHKPVTTCATLNHGNQIHFKIQSC